MKWSREKNGKGVRGRIEKEKRMKKKVERGLQENEGKIQTGEREKGDK